MVRVRWGLLGSPPEVAISPTQVLCFGKGVSESRPHPQGREFRPTSWGRKCLHLVLEVLLYGSVVPISLSPVYLFISLTSIRRMSARTGSCVSTLYCALSSHSQFPQAPGPTQRCVRSVLLSPGRVKAGFPVWPLLTPSFSASLSGTTAGAPL